MTRDVHWCVTVDYQQIANDNIANQIHGFAIDYGKFILISDIPQFLLEIIRSRDAFRPIARKQKDLMDYKALYPDAQSALQHFVGDFARLLI